MPDIHIREDLKNQYINSTSSVTFAELESAYNALQKIVYGASKSNSDMPEIEDKGRLRPIMSQYLWKDNTRSHSPIETQIHRMKLEDICCPQCEEKFLINSAYPNSDPEKEAYNIPEYRVVCDSCDWCCPVDPIEDCGESIAEFKSWLGAFFLIGCPEEYVNVNCCKYFFKENNDELKRICSEEPEVCRNSHYLTPEETVRNMISYCCTLVSKDTAKHILNDVMTKLEGGVYDG